ncbi:MAG: Plug domain-containing protein, partial [bacterium]|nr:Plug domain-containing protein [bacterium]
MSLKSSKLTELIRVAFICLSFQILFTGIVSAAGLSDTVELPGQVVSASRIPLAENALPAASTIWSLTQSDRLEVGSPAALLSQLPGFRAYSSGNLWGNYHLDSRGFYGAGQAEYSLVTLDGIPLNKASSGITNWNVLDLFAVDRVESVRGPSSAEFGDYAFGGLLSLSTNSSPVEKSVVSVSSASDEAYAGSAALTRNLGGFVANLTLSSR